MMLRKKTVFFSTLCLLLILYSVGRIHLARCRSDLGVRYTMSVASIPPKLAPVLAGEFKGIAADYLLLEIGAFIGSNQKIDGEDWKRIAIAFEQALELDPYSQQAYVYVQGNLPWGGEMPGKAIELLDISRRHRTWDWRPGYYMGFNYYYFFSDYAAASERFLDAAKIKDAPVLLAVLGGRLAVKGGRTSAGISVLKTMLADPELDERSQRDIADRVSALEGVLAIEEAIERYRERYGRGPALLADIVEEGILAELPPNPYNTEFRYDRDTDRVFFDTVK